MQKSVLFYDFFIPGTPPRTILIRDDKSSQSNSKSRQDDHHRRCVRSRESKAVSLAGVSSSAKNYDWLSLREDLSPCKVIRCQTMSVPLIKTSRVTFCFLYNGDVIAGNERCSSHKQHGTSKSKSKTNAPASYMNIWTTSLSSSTGSNWSSLFFTRIVLQNKRIIYRVQERLRSRKPIIRFMCLTRHLVRRFS